MRYLSSFIFIVVLLLNSLQAKEVDSKDFKYNISILGESISLQEALRSSKFKKVSDLIFEDIMEQSSDKWIKLSLENNSDHLLKKGILFFWVYANLELYYISNGEVKYSTKLVDNDRVGVVYDTFSLLPNEKIQLFIKANNHSKYDIFNSLSIVNEKDILKAITTEYSLFKNGLFYGILLSMFFFNIIVYFLLKEKSLLFYCISILVIILFISDTTYIVFEWLPLNDEQIILFRLVFTPSFYFLSFVLFTKYFFETHKNRLINYFINANILIVLLMTIYNLFSLDTSIYKYMVFILPLFCLIGFYYLNEYLYPSLLYILSFPFLTFPYLAYQTSIYEYIFIDTTFINYVQIFSTIASVFLCFSIYVKLQDIIIEKLKYQKELLIKSRFAAMGEMISNIAHQWRQPLNNVSVTLAKMEMINEVKPLTQVQLRKNIDDANTQLHYMSSTIDDFLNFFSHKKEKKLFIINEAIEYALVLTNSSIKHEKIELSLQCKEFHLTTYCNELVQALMIIISNAIDALKNQTEDRRIVITAKDGKIEIKDNAGGIDSSLIDRVFEPYVSTKDKKNGTGLGLYIAKTIIEKNIGGRLSVKNCENGACFIIDLSAIK